MNRYLARRHPERSTARSDHDRDDRGYEWANASAMELAGHLDDSGGS